MINTELLNRSLKLKKVGNMAIDYSFEAKMQTKNTPTDLVYQDVNVDKYDLLKI